MSIKDYIPVGKLGGGIVWFGSPLSFQDRVVLYKYNVHLS